MTRRNPKSEEDTPLTVADRLNAGKRHKSEDERDGKSWRCYCDCCAVLREDMRGQRVWATREW